ncbi:hypothetical protein [[Mycobacterium] vasticus]|uniref:Uncharacterized protein n=1 Tax=[Mycobacterium] vasticus TaxID=2875777 RepID=A0ABU5Z0A9_9MYCO|nr:hypothetical protein [Mycolicibacter sp. MYC017]MEB3070818.1 hypothetical protein [Mycolicibacter sp. MYC017]
MIRVIVVVLAAGALGVLDPAAPADAAPRCLFQGDWNCEGSPPYQGPLMPTWDTPGTYGGWTTNPVQCDVVTRECRQVTTYP